MNNEYTYKDAFKYLHISNSFLSINEKSIIFKPLRIEKNFWIVIVANQLPEKLTLNITADSPFAVPVESTLSYIDNLEDIFYHYKLTLLSPFPEIFQQRIDQYIAICNFSDKRKETRYDIGLSNCKAFSLESPEQQLFLDEFTRIKCIISNASIHGVLLTGQANASCKIGNKIVKLCCKFTNQDLLVLNAYIVRIENKTKELYRYSLNFIEPIPFKWQERISSYAMNVIKG